MKELAFLPEQLTIHINDSVYDGNTFGADDRLEGQRGRRIAFRYAEVFAILRLNEITRIVTELG